MKKFIFSAIAMVAFSGSSMANTIEVDETFGSQNEILELEKSLFPCSDAYFSNVSLLIYVGLTESEARDVAQKVYDKCLSDNYSIH